MVSLSATSTEEIVYLGNYDVVMNKKELKLSGTTPDKISVKVQATYKGESLYTGKITYTDGNDYTHSAPTDQVLCI